ncbi:MAG: heme-binding protein [Rhodoferax sp.]|nr:heme-binding protein [Rhodoferax sp.]
MKILSLSASALMVTAAGALAADADQRPGPCRHTRRAVVEAGLKPAGEAVIARYRAPFVPPPRRRNEVWLSLAP